MAQLSLRRESPGAVIRVFPWVIWVRRAARGRTEIWCIRRALVYPWPGLTRGKRVGSVSELTSSDILILLHSRRRPALALWELFGSEVVPYYFKVFVFLFLFRLVEAP